MEAGIYPGLGEEADIYHRIRVNLCLAAPITQLASEVRRRVNFLYPRIFETLDMSSDSLRHTRRSMQRSGKLLLPTLQTPDRSLRALAASTYTE